MTHNADDHDHDHDHSELGEMDLRVRALQTVLTQKGYVDPAALDALIDTYQTRIGPRNGARVVARSWVDPAFREWLLRDASGAIASLGYSRSPGRAHDGGGEHRRAAHMVVCTLCSCYPWPVLGLPPTWYKSAPYRSRAVKDPRGVLAEFGVRLPESTAIRVWDSTAEVRYLVVPQRPAGTEGWDEDALAGLVTRDSMIGIAGDGLARSPEEQPDMGREQHHPSPTSAARTGGAGTIVPEPEGELFHAPWEPRVLALVLAMGATGSWNIDQSRRARETLAAYAAPELLPDLVRRAREVLAERGLAQRRRNRGRARAASAGRIRGC